MCVSRKRSRVDKVLSIWCSSALRPELHIKMLSRDDEHLERTGQSGHELVEQLHYRLSTLSSLARANHDADIVHFPSLNS